MTPSEALVKGRDFLQANKWGRGDYYNPETQSFCAVGALFAGNLGKSYYVTGVVEKEKLDFSPIYTAQKYLDNVLQTMSAGNSATTFNDRVAKRKRDVISLFNKAIKLAQEESN